jgi:hypothetical protein
MTDVVRFTGSRLPARVEQQQVRALARVQKQQAVLSAEEIARVETIADVTEAALLAVSHISALESLLVMRTPRAEERLRHLVDAGTFGMTEVVLGASRRLR